MPAEPVVADREAVLEIAYELRSNSDSYSKNYFMMLLRRPLDRLISSGFLSCDE